MADAINAKMVLLEQRKKELALFLAEAEEPPPLLHPSMALQYRKRVQQLYGALQDEEEEKRVEAADILRSLVDQIVLPPPPRGRQGGDRCSGRSRRHPDDCRTNAKPRGVCGGVAGIVGCGGRI